MAITRAALALSFVASALQTSTAEPCAPRADLAGDAEAVARVAVELRRLGVDVRTDGAPVALRSSSCPAIAAAVGLDGDGIAVAVRVSQRSEGRVVSDAALAAAWIDSWLRDDFGVTLPDSVPVRAVPALAPPPSAPVSPVAEARARTALLERFSLAASFVQAWSADGASWSGAAASACTNAGDVCVGGRVGLANARVDADFTAASKRDLAVLATVSYSSAVGRMSVAPELGVGLGRLTTSRIEGCKVVDPMMCDPMTDPICGKKDLNACAYDASPGDGLVYVGDNFSTTTYAPRISAALRIAIPLFDHVWLDGLAAATAAPLGHTRRYATKEDYDGTTQPNAGAYPLPGDPMFGVQLGIGIRVGAR